MPDGVFFSCTEGHAGKFEDLTQCCCGVIPGANSFAGIHGQQ